MTKNYFIQLLRKYFTSGVTKEEQGYIESYYDLFENEPDILDTLNEEEKIQLKNEIRGGIDHSITEEVPRGKIASMLPRRAIAIAAAIAVIIIAAGLFYNYSGPAKKELPAMLAITAKENRTVLLSDGSKVILYAGGKLSYPASFDGTDKREISLEGVAYFDVFHNAAQPFVIHTGDLETRVLGTAFLIKAIHGENIITVTVNRGKVQVSDQDKRLGIVVRNEQLIYNKLNAVFVQKKVDADSLVTWAARELHFDNLTLAEAVDILNEQFSTRIVVSDNLVSSKRFTATFPANVSIDEALKIICEFNDLTYRYDKTSDSIVIENK